MHTSHIALTELLYLCNQQLMYEVGQAVMGHQGLHNVLMSPALGALMRLDIEPLYRVMLAQPLSSSYLYVRKFPFFGMLSLCRLFLGYLST